MQGTYVTFVAGELSIQEEGWGDTGDISVPFHTFRWSTSLYDYEVP
jgi:hypothetical protein